MNLAEADPEGQARLAAFLQALQASGWADSRNVRIETRWSAGDPEHARAYAAELVALAPDVILADGGTTVGPLLNATRTVPVVFVNVTDPVGGGFVESLARPAGNATGFTLFEYSISVKWLELLKEMSPRVKRVAVLRNPALASGGGQLGAIQTAAPSLGVDLRPVDVREASEDRARHWRLRALIECWPHRHGEHIGGPASRTDHLAGGTAPPAGGLPVPLLCRERRSRLLRS